MDIAETWYYDCAPGPWEGDPSLLWVERFYCFDWEAFSSADHQRLDAIYAELPGWVGLGSQDCQGCPHWFGTDEENPPYLCAWEEPPYLQVNGILPAREWEEWDAKFRELAAGFPKRKLAR